MKIGVIINPCDFTPLAIKKNCFRGNNNTVVVGFFYRKNGVLLPVFLFLEKPGFSEKNGIVNFTPDSFCYPLARGDNEPSFVFHVHHMGETKV